mgnify:CR=1 FL=1
MKYYKYITESEVKMASCDIYDLYAWQPPEDTNGTDWVLAVDDSIPTRSVLIDVSWITPQEAEEQGYISNDLEE